MTFKLVRGQRDVQHMILLLDNNANSIMSALFPSVTAAKTVRVEWCATIPRANLSALGGTISALSPQTHPHNSSCMLHDRPDLCNNCPRLISPRRSLGYEVAVDQARRRVDH